MKISEIKKFEPIVFDAVNRLLPQLDPDAEPLTEEKLKLIIESDSSHLFIAKAEDNRIAGMLTAAIYIIPTGTKFWIEDVIVDESFRGKGIGKDLMIHAIEFAKSVGAKSVDLTSRPFRIAANKLYQDMGFELRETNVYRYSLKK